MEYLYFGVIIFIFSLACYDLTAGVSTDAGNFLSAAVGSKASKLPLVFAVAAVGIFTGAITSNGMMDIARHGILNPDYYYFNEVICIFLAVGVSDVILLDIFNTLGMPTSSTVSMVFELLGGSTALAIVKIMHDPALSYANLINTDKALSIILGIFLSVAIAFVFGLVVMWLTRTIFTFKYRQKSHWAVGIFGGISITAIMYFLLVAGFGKSSFMTPEVRDIIETHKGTILWGCLIAFTIISQILDAFKINIFRVIVLFGTFALAMAFAGNDLVNFIGVPLAALSSYQYYTEAGAGDPSQFCVSRLHETAHTPIYFLIAAGAIMVFALINSHKFINESGTQGKDFFPNTYLNAAGTNEFNRYWHLRNTLGISLLEGFNKYAKFGFAVYAQHEIRRYTQVVDSISGLATLPEGLDALPCEVAHRTTENLMYVGGQLTKQHGSILTYDAMAKFGVLGAAGGDDLQPRPPQMLRNLFRPVVDNAGAEEQPAGGPQRVHPHFHVVVQRFRHQRHHRHQQECRAKAKLPPNLRAGKKQNSCIRKQRRQMVRGAVVPQQAVHRHGQHVK